MNAFDEGEKEPESRDDYMRQKEEMQKEYGRIFRSLCSGDCEILENDDYIACMESKSERYADLSYIKGMGDAISLLKNIGALNSQETLSMNVE